MHPTPTPGHLEPDDQDKGDYVNEKPTTFVHEEELEPVVTPKTWVVVGVRYLVAVAKRFALTSRT